MKIRLVVPERGPFSAKCFSNSKGLGNQGSIFYFNDEPGEEDIVFFLESGYSCFTQTLNRTAPLVYLCAETSFEESFVQGMVNKAYLQQFDIVVSPYDLKGLTHIRERPYIPPMLDTYHGDRAFRDREWLLKIRPASPELVIKDRVAIICSTKAYSSGHRQRLAFTSSIVKKAPHLFDWYGHGKKGFRRKLDILQNYKYVLVIENVISDWIVSEKVLDPLFFGNTVFYGGSHMIAAEYSDSIIELDLSSVDSSLRIIERAMSVGQGPLPSFIDERSEFTRREGIMRKDFLLDRVESLAKQILKNRDKSSGNSQVVVVRTREDILREKITNAALGKRLLLRTFGAPSSTRLRYLRKLFGFLDEYFFY